MKTNTTFKHLSLVVAVLLMAVLQPGCKKDDTGPDNTIPPDSPGLTGTLQTGQYVHMATGAVASGSSLVVGSEGASLGLENLTLSVAPGGSLSSTVKIVAEPIESHTFGEDINPVSPLIVLDATGSTGSGLYLLTYQMPQPIADDEFVMAFYYHADRQRLEGLPITAYSSTSITVATRHFSSIFFSIIKIARLPKTIGTGFLPALHGWSFSNNGSYLFPKGICAGMSTTAMYIYLEHEQNLTEKSDNPLESGEPTPTVWFDDNYGIQYGTYAQQKYENDNSTWSLLQGVNNGPDHSNYYAFAYSMLVTGEPQLVAMWGTKGGHAMVVYAIADGKLLVYDPNYPRAYRTIGYSGGIGGSFQPYSSAANAKEAASGNYDTYTKINYAAKSAVCEWEYLSAGWLDYGLGTIMQNDFLNQTELKLKVMPEGETTWTEVSSSYATAKNKMTLDATCIDPAATLYLTDRDGNPVPANTAITLATGLHKIGVMATKGSGANEGWYGFKWFTIQVGQAATDKFRTVRVFADSISMPMLNSDNVSYTAMPIVWAQFNTTPWPEELLWTGNDFYVSHRDTNTRAVELHEVFGTVNSSGTVVTSITYMATAKTYDLQNQQIEQAVRVLRLSDVPLSSGFGTRANFEVTGTSACAKIAEFSWNKTTIDPDLYTEFHSLSYSCKPTSSVKVDFYP